MALLYSKARELADAGQDAAAESADHYQIPLHITGLTPLQSYYWEKKSGSDEISKNFKYLKQGTWTKSARTS